MGLKAVTVAKRLFLGFGLMLAILAAVAGVAIFKVGAINAALSIVNEEHARIQRYAINFRGSAHDRSIAIRDVVLAADGAARQKETARIDTLAAFYAQSASPLQTLAAASSQRAEIERLYGAIQEIEGTAVATTKRIVGLTEAGDRTAAMELLWRDAKPQYERWLAAINALIDHQEALIQQETRKAMGEAAAFLHVMLGSMALAAAFGLALAWIVSRSITVPLARAVAATHRIASGDLSGRIEIDRQDEVGELQRALAGMQDSLSGVVGTVRGNAQRVATASAEIAQGNQDLSSRTEQQASSLQQSAASMDQLSSTVRQNADNARQANQLAQGASEVAIKGGEVVAQVVSTIKGIQASSQRIADIIGVIDGIAFQTNILALNAAVEAARAGEQGRGFAVVAGEVRGLAHRSAEAAKEIKRLITDSVERVESGSALADQAGATMDEVVGAIHRVTDIMGEISAASAEQDQGVGQMGRAVSQMDQATQQNAALVEQSAAAAESLKQQAQALVQAVAAFKLAQEPAGAAPAAGSVAPAASPRAPAANPNGQVPRPQVLFAPARTSAVPVATPAPVTKPAVPKPAPAQPAAAPAAAAAAADDDWTSF